MFPGDAVTEVLCVEKPLKLSVFVGCWSIWGDSEYLKKKSWDIRIKNLLKKIFHSE